MAFMAAALISAHFECPGLQTQISCGKSVRPHMNKLSLKAKIGIGIVASYSVYSCCSILLSNREIAKRQAKYKKNSAEKFRPLSIFGKYQNPFLNYEHETLFHFAFNQIRKLFSARETQLIDRDELPLHQPNLDLIFNNLQINNDIGQSAGSMILPQYPLLNNRILFTWLGQSCAFVQISNLSILTDPIFNDYIISKKFGPKRITKSPVQLHDLPVPELVLVSHNHPDHLEQDSIGKLSDKSSVWVVPKGVKQELLDNKVPEDKILEMTWWEKLDISKIVNGSGKMEIENKWEIVCLPSMHWSGKYLIDSNKSLWCSYLVVKNGKAVFYHVGDTGYNKELFQTIGNLYPKGVELIMAPIGQYCPDANKSRHINPEEAIEIMQDVNGKRLIGVHYGTFVLSTEHYLEPKIRLQQARKLCLDKVVDPGEFGKTQVISYDG